MRRFTDEEKRIAQLIADGLTYEEMGRRLGVSASTAKQHTALLRNALGVKYKRQIPGVMRQLGLM